jgi:hypothetical protein
MVSELVVSKELAAQEKIIDDNINGFYAVGQALMRIRDDRLYMVDHANFEAYCRERWKFSSRRAYQLIDAVTVVDEQQEVSRKLPNVKLEEVCVPLVHKNTPSSQTKETAEETEELEEVPAPPRNERQARKAAEPDKQAEPKSDIPPKLLPAFDEAKAFTSLIRQCGEMRTELDRLAESPAGVFLAEAMTRLVADLVNLQRGIKFAKPHGVCPYCKGKGCKPEGPGLKAPCRGTGWVVRGVKGDGQ